MPVTAVRRPPFDLLQRFLVRQDVASILRSGWIDRYVALVDVLNNPVLIDNERRAISVASLFVEDSIILHHGAFEIAEKRESDAILFAELAVGWDAVYTEAKNLCVGRFEFGDISLIRLHFLRSTTGESQNIEGKHDVFLALEVTELVPH